jgi:hypothetical protein
MARKAADMVCGPLAPETAPVLGLRGNLAQFSPLVLVNAFVGGMVGLERAILPLIAASGSWARTQPGRTTCEGGRPLHVEGTAR